MAGEKSMPDHALSRRLRQRDRDATVADREFDQRTVRRAGKLDVERDVLGHPH
jgi:hypothetical protein